MRSGVRKSTVIWSSDPRVIAFMPMPPGKRCCRRFSIGKLKDSIIPFPVREFQVQDVSCACSDLAYLEFEKEHAFAASQIEKFWKESHFPPCIYSRENSGKVLFSEYGSIQMNLLKKKLQYIRNFRHDL